MKPQTMRDPTGPFNRKKLLAFLEKKAKEEKDWENVIAYVKKAPGMLAHQVGSNRKRQYYQGT